MPNLRFRLLIRANRDPACIKTVCRGTGRTSFDAAVRRDSLVVAEASAGSDSTHSPPLLPFAWSPTQKSRGHPYPLQRQGLPRLLPRNNLRNFPIPMGFELV